MFKKQKHCSSFGTCLDSQQSGFGQGYLSGWLHPGAVSWMVKLPAGQVRRLQLCRHRFLRPSCTRSCAACCRWPCFGRGVGPDAPHRSLPILTILWFCETLCNGNTWLREIWFLHPCLFLHFTFLKLKKPYLFNFACWIWKCHDHSFPGEARLPEDIHWGCSRWPAGFGNAPFKNALLARTRQMLEERCRWPQGEWQDRRVDEIIPKESLGKEFICLYYVFCSSLVSCALGTDIRELRLFLCPCNLVEHWIGLYGLFPSISLRLQNWVNSTASSPLIQISLLC